MYPGDSFGECRASCTRAAAEDEQARRMGALLKAHQQQENEKKHANGSSKKHTGRDKSTQRGTKGQKQRKGGGGGGGRNSSARGNSQSQGQRGGARGHLVTASQQTASAATPATNQPRYTTLFETNSHSGRGSNRIGKKRNVANGNAGNRFLNSGSGGGGDGDGEKSMSFLQVIHRVQAGGADELSVIDIVSALPKMEKHQKGILDSLKAQLDSSTPPVPPLYHAISRSLWDKLVVARSSLFGALRSLVFRNKKAANRRKLLNRMWMVYYRELDVIQQRIKSNATGQNQLHVQTQQQQLRASQAVRALLFTVIGEAELAIKSVSDALQEQEQEQPPHSAPRGGTRSSPSKQRESESSANTDNLKVSGKESFPLVMALGDLARYKQIHRPISEQRDWSVAEAYYHRAFRLEPESGKVWNQLAIISSLRKDRFAALYHYLRAICAENAFPALDNILTLHSRWQNQVADMQHKHRCNAKEAEFLPAEENTHRFLAYLVVAAGSCLSSSAGPPDDLIEATVTHLTACLRHRSGLKESFGLRLPPYLLRVVLLCICVVEACGKAWVKAGNEEHEWTSDPATRGGIRMCFSIAAVLADASAADHSQDGVPLPAVCMFLDWLRCESYLGEGMIISEGKTFWSTMASIARLISVTTCSSDKLPNITLDSMGTTVALSASIPLSEDIECQGLPPLRRAITSRLVKCSSQAVAVAAVAPGSQEAHAIRLARLDSFADWAVAQGWLLKEESSAANSSPQFTVPDKARHGGLDEVVFRNVPSDTDLNNPTDQQQQNTYDLNANMGGGGILPWNDMWLSDVPMWPPPLVDNSGPGPVLKFEDSAGPSALTIPSQCFLSSLERFVNAPTGTGTGWDNVEGDKVEDDEDEDTTEHIAITAALAGLQEDIFDEDIGSSLTISGETTEAVRTREGLGGTREAFVGGPMSQVCRVCCSELKLGSTACGLCGTLAPPPPPPGL